MDIEEQLAALLPDGWATDGYGIDSCLITPCGCLIELDGECPHGLVSPLRELGVI